METSNRYDLNEKGYSIRSGLNKYSAEEPFYGTFQPSSYLNYPDTRSFENFFNERQADSSLKLRDSQFSEIRARSSAGFDKSSRKSFSNFNEVNEPQQSSQEKYKILENIIVHKDSIIEDLKLQKHSLSREIDELLERIRGHESKEFEIKNYLAQIEELNYKLGQSEDFINSLQNEKERLTKVFNDTKDFYAKTTTNEETLAQENKSLKAKNETLNQHIQYLDSQLKSKIEPSHTKTEFTVFKLQEQIKDLQNENENLVMSLNSRPTFKDLKDKEMIISELKEKIKKKPSRSRSTSQTRDQNRESIRKDKELFNLNKGEAPSSATMTIVLNDLLAALKLQNFHEILPAVNELKSKCKSSDLEVRIGRLVKDLSPEGTFHPKPSPSQI